MDADCEIRGPIRPVVDISTDVALHIGVGNHPQHDRLRVIPTSRIVVFRSTVGARQLAATWAAHCEQQLDARLLNDEQALMQAVARTPGLTLTILGRRYSAPNPWKAPDDAVIIHKTVSRERLSRGLL